jgi:hypothetical protein
MKHGSGKATGAWGKHTAGDNANVKLWGKKVSPKGSGGKGGNCTAAGGVLHKGGKKY